MARTIDQFVWLMAIVGLPIFALSVRAIWKPASPADRPRLPIAARIVAPIAVLFAIGVPVLGVPLLGLAAWLLPRRPDATRTLGDRVGWTIFAAGIALMLTMTAYAVAEEGALRSFATIRLHSRIFLGLAALALAGPLGVFLFGVRPENKPSGDDPLA